MSIDLLLTLVIPWIIMSMIAGSIADAKGRSALGFFLLAFFFTPLVGVVCAVLAERNAEHDRALGLASGTLRQCPQCAEAVRAAALKCRYCLSDLPRLEADRTRSIPGTDPGHAPSHLEPHLGAGHHEIKPNVIRT
jgi:hypothetical protein